ncbi:MULTISPECIES: hypothetical protein [unclassified Microbacterium]|uniref:hypothetical protein n=1 Tax=unclassified Microbacterium TaxID=2609290 RepID=UPI00301A1C05
MASTKRPSWEPGGRAPETEVDAYGVPLDSFGEPAPFEFFEVLGRILAVNGKIEYLHDRLGHLPSSETSGTRKVEQFLGRVTAEKGERNAIVHSHWTFGAHTSRSDVVTAIRYKVRKQVSGEVATVSIVDVPGSEREHDFTLYTLDDLRRVLRRSVTTMQIGEQAYAYAMLKRAAARPATDLSQR